MNHQTPDLSWASLQKPGWPRTTEIFVGKFCKSEESPTEITGPIPVEWAGISRLTGVGGGGPSMALERYGWLSQMTKRRKMEASTAFLMASHTYALALNLFSGNG